MKFMLKILVPCVLKISLLATLFYGGVFAYDYFVVTHPDVLTMSGDGGHNVGTLFTALWWGLLYAFGLYFLCHELGDEGLLPKALKAMSHGFVGVDRDRFAIVFLKLFGVRVFMFVWICLSVYIYRYVCVNGSGHMFFSLAPKIMPVLVLVGYLYGLVLSKLLGEYLIQFNRRFSVSDTMDLFVKKVNKGVVVYSQGCFRQI